MCVRHHFPTLPRRGRACPRPDRGVARHLFPTLPWRGRVARNAPGGVTSGLAPGGATSGLHARRRVPRRRMALSEAKPIAPHRVAGLGSPKGSRRAVPPARSFRERGNPLAFVGADAIDRSLRTAQGAPINLARRRCAGRRKSLHPKLAARPTPYGGPWGHV